MIHKVIVSVTLAAHDHKIVFVLIFISKPNNFKITTEHARTGKNGEKTINQQTISHQMLA